MAITPLQEIEELGKGSVAASKQAAQSLEKFQGSAADLIQFRDKLLDLSAEAIALYKLTALQARRTDSLEEVAIIWKETHSLYVGMFNLWQGLHAFDPATEPLVEHYRQILIRLRDESNEHYQFHAAE